MFSLVNPRMGVRLNGYISTPGPRGATGSTGPQGPRGATGPQGIRGLQGLRGVTGPTSFAGLATFAGTVAGTTGKFANLNTTNGKIKTLTAGSICSGDGRIYGGDICGIDPSGAAVHANFSKGLVVANTQKYLTDPTIQLDTDGTVTTTSIRTWSDATLKENIVDARKDYIDDLDKLRVVNYNFIGSDKKELGFIAQELEQVFPTMVTSGDNVKKSYAVSALIPMIVSAVQSLSARVKELEAK